MEPSPNRIQDTCIAQHLSIRKLAQLAQMDASALRAKVQGRTSFKVEEAYRVAAVLGRPFEELFPPRRPDTSAPAATQAAPLVLYQCICGAVCVTSPTQGGGVSYSLRQTPACGVCTATGGEVVEDTSDGP